MWIILTDLDDNNEPVENKLKSDEERKYGKIPARIYMFYLRACGMVTLVVFFMSTLLWQVLRVFTDVWLREWTDNEDDDDDNSTTASADVCLPLKYFSTWAFKIIVSNAAAAWMHEAIEI